MPHPQTRQSEEPNGRDASVSPLSALSIGGSRVQKSEGGWPTPSELNASSPDIARELIELPRIDPHLLHLSKLLARRISGLYSGEREKRTKVAAEERGIRKGAAFASVEAFESSLKAVIDSEFRSEASAHNFQHLLTLTSFFATKTTSPATGYMSKLPTGLFYSAQSTPLADPVFKERASIILRLYFTEGGVGQHPLRTARDIETHFDLKALQQQSGLSKLANELNPIEVLNVAFPGALSGRDPPVRRWFIRYNGKAQGHDEIAAAAAWVLEFGEKVVSREDGALRFDLAAIRERNWFTTLSGDRYGLHSLLSGAKPQITGVDALALGAKHLGRHDLFGPGPDQLSVDAVRVRRSWGTKSGEARIDATLRRVDLELRRKHPGLFESPAATGALLPEQLKELRGIGGLIEEVAPNFLTRSGLTAAKCMRRLYPEAFGFAPGQIKPWEHPNQVQWRSNVSHHMVKMAFGYALGQLGLGRLTLRGNELQLEFTRGDFDGWLETFRPESPSLKTALYQAKLSSVIETGVSTGDIRGAYCLLFDHPDAERKIASLEATLPKAGWVSVARALLAERGDRYRETIAVLSRSEIPAAAAHFRPAPSDIEAKLHRDLDEPPYILGQASFMSQFDARLLRELPGTPLSKVRPPEDRTNPHDTIFASALAAGEHPGVVALREFVNADLAAKAGSVGSLSALHRILVAAPAVGAGSAPIRLSGEQQLAILRLVHDTVVDSAALSGLGKQVTRALLGELLRDPEKALESIQSAYRTAQFRERGSAGRNFMTPLHVINDLINLALNGAQTVFQSEAGVVTEPEAAAP